MAGGGPVPIAQKYTLRSSGIWEKIRRLLVLVPNRSTGNPLVPYYRVPSTGSHPDAELYREPKTIPASDIANNPYYKRDTRRAYPQVASYSQSDIGGLLLYGSAATPRLAKGETGQQALTTVKDGSLSLISALASLPKEIVFGEVLAKDGQPPFPAPLTKKTTWKLLEEPESGMYPDKYPVRTFT
ncbi:uncharacterized protein V2V93DRAFT_372616 [Kockiozyma suomiensis]|uniref:uncharacterized protein n=1 Tax=Kockiozyma suomiensis TaxID=1337062 RepID=UPI00334342A5